VALLGYDEGMLPMLCAPRRELTVSIPLHRDDGTIELLTGHRCSAWQQVLTEAEHRRLSLRTAATRLAVRRVAEAHRQRGRYP